MEGDVMNDGSYLAARIAKAKDQKSAIWTFPTRDGADNRTIVAHYDNGETNFKVILQLRQRPSSHASYKTTWGFDIWSTNRRGSIYIESLHVCVLKSKGSVMPPVSTAIPPNVDATSFRCPVQQATYEYLKTLNIPESMFDRKGNRCYCNTCYPDTFPKFMDVAGERYILPHGCVRFGLATNPVFTALNDIWDSWHIAFHGCNPKDVIDPEAPHPPNSSRLHA